MVKLRPVRAGDAEALAANLRPADAAEIEAASGRNRLKTIQTSLRLSSHHTAAEANGELLALFGLAPLSLVGGRAAPWLLGTRALVAYPRPLARLSKRYVAEALRYYETLENFVDARNTASLRLLGWLGFTIGEAEPFGVAGLPFHRFTMRR